MGRWVRDQSSRGPLGLKQRITNFNGKKGRGVALLRKISWITLK